MSAFAHAEQLAAWLGLDSIDTARADLVLNVATGSARSATGQQLDLVADDVLTLAPTVDHRTVYLPQVPVRSVASVEVLGRDGETWATVTPSEYTVSPTGVLTRRAWSRYWEALRALRITYTHGLDPIPDDLVGVVLGLAGRLYANPLGLMGESEGGRSNTYGATGQTFNALELDVLGRYAIGQVA